MPQQCVKCKTIKELSEFGNNRWRKNGKHNTCLKCAREYDSKRNNSKFYTHKKYLKRREYFLNYQKGYAINNGERIKARELVRRAISKGKLIKKPCMICGKIKSLAHHPDYSKPLKVLWLCQKHHRLLHNNLK